MFGLTAPAAWRLSSQSLGGGVERQPKFLCIGVVESKPCCETLGHIIAVPDNAFADQSL
jgi:hypothetical protein